MSPFSSSSLLPVPTRLRPPPPVNGEGGVLHHAPVRRRHQRVPRVHGSQQAVVAPGDGKGESAAGAAGVVGEGEATCGAGVRVVVGGGGGHQSGGRAAAVVGQDETVAVGEGGSCATSITGRLERKSVCTGTVYMYARVSLSACNASFLVPVESFASCTYWIQKHCVILFNCCRRYFFLFGHCSLLVR